MATSKHETRFVLTAQDKTKVALKSAEDGIKGLDGVVSKLTAGFAGLAGLGGIGLLINKQVDAARQADAYSKALGVNVETLTAMQSAFQTVGIQSDKTADILKDVAEKIGDAFRNDAGEAKEALEGLGLSVAHIAQLSPDEQLLAIANALGQVGTQGEKIQIMEALASDAALLLPLLDNNAEKLRELTQAAKDSGAALTESEVQTLKDAGEAMAKLDRTSDALGQTLAVTLAPHLTSLLEFADDMVKKFGKAETAVSDFFDQFYSAGNNEAFTSIENAQNKLDLMVRRAARLRSGIEEGGFGPESAPARRLANLEKEIELQRENVRLAERQNELMLQYREGGKFQIEVENNGLNNNLGCAAEDKQQEEYEKFRQSLLTREEAIMESQARQLEQLQMFKDAGLEMEMSYDEMRTRIVEDTETKLTGVYDQEAKKRAQIESNLQSQLAGLRQIGLNQALGVLNMLAQKSEGWALAALAVEKGMALAQISVNEANAIVATKTLYALGPAAPGALSAALADVTSTANFARGMVIASGLYQASQMGSGGAGSVGNVASAVQAPAPLLQPPTNPVETAPTQGNQITILIKGEGPFDDMVRNSIEVLSDNDELVFING